MYHAIYKKGEDYYIRHSSNDEMLLRTEIGEHVVLRPTTDEAEAKKTLVELIEEKQVEVVLAFDGGIMKRK